MNGGWEENAVIDLNYPPAPVDANLNVNPNLSLQIPAASATGESDDDDVVICSPTSFRVARRNRLARRNREAMQRSNGEMIEVIDLGPSHVQRGHSEPTVRSVPGPRNPSKRARPTRFIPNADSGTNLESNGKDKGKKVAQDPEPPKEVPPPKEPTFSCPICMDPFVEETSTKCGHIFCKECIRMAIKVHHKCPTCRKNLKVKDTHRIYLPKCD